MQKPQLLSALAALSLLLISGEGLSSASSGLVNPPQRHDPAILPRLLPRGEKAGHNNPPAERPNILNTDRVQKETPDIPEDKGKIRDNPEVLKKAEEDAKQGGLKNAEAGWYRFGSNEKIPAGKTGVQIREIKDKDGNMVKLGLIYYAEDKMARHAAHVEYTANAFPFTRGQAYKLRAHDRPRSETVSRGPFGGYTIRHTVKDENPPASWDYMDKMYTIMKVPDAESVHQGWLNKWAKNEIGEDGLIAHFDNRRVKKDSDRGTILRGPRVKGYPEPEEVIPKFDRENRMEAITFLTEIPMTEMPKRLRVNKRAYPSIPNTRSIHSREENGDFITHAPLYNIQMQGDNVWDIDSANISDSATKRSTPGPLYLPRSDGSVMGGIQDSQQNASDTSKVKGRENVETLIFIRSVLQDNATAILLPFIDAIMNGSSSNSAEAQVWSLYSMIQPSVSYFGPFMGDRDYFDSLALTEHEQTVMNHTGQFNRFVYERAALAVNETGLLKELQDVTELLAGYDPSLYPDAFKELDAHDTEPMLDYLKQWYAYNDVPFSAPENGSNVTLERHTPAWVWDELDLNALINGTSINDNSTTT